MAPVNRSTLPADSIIDYTLARMQERLAMRNDAQAGQERSGLLFMGNVHDAYPRALLLDTRLSPLDKVAWMMIRQYALQNDGAIFPSYDELQQLLASPGAGLASRGTVSRALTMLRLTGWLSLCKKVRDGKGRVRGNIYAQHDEPLSARDAETFDPGWLDLVADACRHKSRAVNETAWQVLTSIQDDPMMRHRHSRVTMIAERLTRLSDAAQCARIQSSTKIELSHSGDEKTLSSKRELSGESRDCSRVRKSHHNNVRSFTQSVIKKTYVSPQADKKPLWEQMLDEVAAGRVSLDDFMAKQSQWVTQLVTQGKSQPLAMQVPPSPPCPVCGGKTSRRKGKNGLFWGCLNYPECKGIVSEGGKKQSGKGRSISSLPGSLKIKLK